MFTTLPNIMRARPWTAKFLFSWAALLALVGCATTHQPPKPPTVAIAVGPVAGAAPTAEHLTRIHQALQPEFARIGLAMAGTRAEADFVATVSFDPTAGPNGRIVVNGIEPTAKFRTATDDGDTPEAREWRRRQHEIELWMERQHRPDPSYQ